MDVESAFNDSSDSAKLRYVEMKKKQNESIKAFVSEKDVSTYGLHAQFKIYAIIKIWRDIIKNAHQSCNHCITKIIHSFATRAIKPFVQTPSRCFRRGDWPARLLF